jgi:hypothetical protein
MSDSGMTTTYPNEDTLKGILRLADAIEHSGWRLTPHILKLAEGLSGGVGGWFACIDCYFAEWCDDERDEKAAEEMQLELHYLTCIEDILTSISETGRCRRSSVTRLRELARSLDELERTIQSRRIAGTAPPTGEQTEPLGKVAEEKKKPGRQPMTPERKELCKAYAQKWQDFRQTYLDEHHTIRGARKAFAKKEGLSLQKSNAMIRSGTPDMPRKRRRKGRG